VSLHRYQSIHYAGGNELSMGYNPLVIVGSVLVHAEACYFQALPRGSWIPHHKNVTLIFGMTVIDLLERSEQRAPSSAAIALRDGVMTYSELAAHCKRVAASILRS
jgi:hypothetical protein